MLFIHEGNETCYSSILGKVELRTQRNYDVKSFFCHSYIGKNLKSQYRGREQCEREEYTFVIDFQYFSAVFPDEGCFI